MGLGFYLLSLKDVSMNGTLGSFSKVARRGELTRLCSSIVRCHPPYIESSGNTRDPDTSRAKDWYSNIYSGRERNTLRMSVVC